MSYVVHYQPPLLKRGGGGVGVGHDDVLFKYFRDVAVNTNDNDDDGFMRQEVWTGSSVNSQASAVHTLPRTLHETSAESTGSEPHFEAGTFSESRQRKTADRSP